MLMIYRLLVPHISVQIINSSRASRRLRRGASRTPVTTLGSLRIDGRKHHTIAPHATNATAALRYITVKPNPIASA